MCLNQRRWDWSSAARAARWSWTAIKHSSLFPVQRQTGAVSRTLLGRSLSLSLHLFGAVITRLDKQITNSQLPVVKLLLVVAAPAAAVTSRAAVTVLALAVITVAVLPLHPPVTILLPCKLHNRKVGSPIPHRILRRGHCCTRN